MSWIKRFLKLTKRKIKMRFFSLILIRIIKFYKFFISPYMGANCRYLQTCSDYCIDSINLNGTFRGCLLGMKRIFRCHPINFLGGGDGFDPAPNLNLKRKKK